MCTARCIEVGTVDEGKLCVVNMGVGGWSTPQSVEYGENEVLVVVLQIGIPVGISGFRLLCICASSS